MKLFGRLKGALNRRQAQFPGTANISSPDTAPDRALARLDRRLNRPLRIALLGEFNTGKSSLATLILGAAIPAAGRIPATSALMLFRFSQQPKLSFVAKGGDRRELDLASARPELRGMQDGHFEVGVPLDWLRRVEILDVPGTGKPTAGPRNDIVHAEIVRSVDLALWCTLATQAWKESEKRTWLQLPPRWRSRSLLVATHADSLRSALDRERVLARLRHEAKRCFRDMLMVSAIQPLDDTAEASDAPPARSAVVSARPLLEPNPELLKIHGGTTLWCCLRDALDATAAERKEAAARVERRITARRDGVIAPSGPAELTATILQGWAACMETLKARRMHDTFPTDALFAGFAQDLTSFRKGLERALSKTPAEGGASLFFCNPALLHALNATRGEGHHAELLDDVITQLDGELREVLQLIEQRHTAQTVRD